MPVISLAPIGHGDVDRVAHIQINPDQRRFAGNVVDAFAAAEPMVDFHAILEDTRIVGFFKIDRGYADQHPFASKGEIGLRGFQIDGAMQGRGIAGGALKVLPPYLRQHYPRNATVALTVNVQNAVAAAVYRRGGFVDTGELFHGGRAGPQHIMRLNLT